MNQVTQIIDLIFNDKLPNYNPINFYAFIVLSFLFCLALVGTFSSRFERLTKYAKQSPSILATVGVCFSFFGIAISLIGLNLTDIQHSIPNLLDGLKIKFIASLMGIFLSTLIKFIQSFVLENKNPENINSDEKIIELLTKIDKSLAENNKNNPEQLLKELKETIAVLPVEFKKQSGLLEAIKTSLVGDGDASVTTQLAKVRIDMKGGLSELNKHNKQYFDELNNNNKRYLGTINKNIKDGFDSQNIVLNSNFNDLTNKFDEFAKLVADGNAKSLIKALEEVMRDFNTKINEQFGDNFKQLNEAVGKLLIWQENYKTHVEKLTDNFEITLTSVETIKTAFSEIENRSQNFTATSEKVHNILVSLDRQLQDLSSHLQAFDELAGNAKNAFPIIEGNLVKLTTGFRNATEQSLSDINSTVKDVSHNLKNTGYEFRATAEQFSGMANNVEKSVKTQELALTGVSDNFKITVDKTLRDLSEQSKISIETHERELQKAVQDQMNHINSAIQSSSELFNKLLTENTMRNTSILEQQITLLDEALQDELKKSIEKMGSILTSLSMQFVNDYTPLTEQLREVVRMAENLKRGR
jgi:uncharacterized protein YukE